MTGKLPQRAMKTEVLGLAHFISMALLLFGAEPPRELLDGLAADGFKEREESQVRLLDWAKKQAKSPAGRLLELSKSSDEPEVRQRCFEILKTLSDLDYLSGGKGFIGITMVEGIENLPGEKEPRSTIRITMVVRDSPAEKAGLKAGDAIVSLNGKALMGGNVLEFFSGTIAEKKPREEVVLGIKRAGGEVEDVRVALGRHPSPGIPSQLGDLRSLDEQARERHFEIWLKEQE